MRAGWFVFLMVFASMLFASAQASAETRTLKLYFIHTKERAEITFKKNGRYQQDGLNKLNKFLRDWRRNEPTKMDPRLFDLVWQVYQNAGGRDYIQRCFRLSLPRHELHAAFPFARRCDEEPAHARQGNGLVSARV